MKPSWIWSSLSTSSHKGLTLILYKVLDKSISADGNPKSNVAVNLKRRGREQGTEVHEGGIGNEQALCGSVRISRQDTLYENLGCWVRPASSLRTCLMSESTSSATDSLAVRRARQPSCPSR
jgi:hypothetical protein